MRGRTPAAAVSEFLAPLQQAIGCLDGHAAITPNRGARHPEIDEPCSWSLNDGGPMVLRTEIGAALEFFASMYWKVIRSHQVDQRFRVTTMGYDYSLETVAGEELWAMHWHPDGASDERKPHLHLGDINLRQTSPISSKTHLVTSRMTLETAVRWCRDFGAKPRNRETFEDDLLLVETPHLLYRNWGHDPEVELEPRR